MRGQDGADAVITVSAGNSVRLQNVTAATLTVNNFVLLNLNLIGTDTSETLTGDIGDDNIQKQAQGYVVPESFTHGTGEQRVRWFTKGYQSGDMSQGDTFSAKGL